MGDTIIKFCSLCDEVFDSIPELDEGVCDDCRENPQLIEDFENNPDKYLK